MLFPQIDPVAFHLGPLSVRWYGIAYLAGVIFGWLYARKLTANDKLWGGARNRIGIKDIDNLPSWVMVGIILGGRIGYATFYQPDHFFGDPMGFFRLWDGGMSFHGGMMGAIVAIALFATKQHIVILSLMDIVACAAPIGLFFGRIANFINGELYGRTSNVPWAIVFPDGGPLPRHPSQIYEALLEGPLLFLILRVLILRGRSLQYPGLTGGVFLTLYGMTRFFVEFFREPDAQVGFIASDLTMGMILSSPMILIGLAVAAYAIIAKPDQNSAC